MTEQDDFTEIFDEDEWEDADFEDSVNTKYPNWYLVKLPGFTERTFQQIRQWLEDDNVHFGDYHKVGWSTICSYSVGVVFESGRDAMMFKLRWR